MLTKIWEAALPLPTTDYYLDTRYERLDVLVSAGGRPLCVVPIAPPPDSRVISADRLRGEIARSLGWRAWEAICGGEPMVPPPPTAPPPISVVVCTRNRPVCLQACLESLSRVEYPEFEVVVVDNASDGGAVREVVLRSGFRYVREERKGLDWARNRGAREARHGVIAYLDDDAFVSPGWLHGIARGFEDPSVSAVTGMVLPAELETAPQQLFEQYGGMSKGLGGRLFDGRRLDAQDLLAPHRCGVGANMAFRRETFAAIGPFDTALDVGTPSSGGGDLDMFHRVLAAGLAIRYEPSAWVRHRHRRDMDGLRRQIYNNGRSFGVLLIKMWKTRGVPRGAVAAGASRWVAGWLLRRLWQRARGRSKFPLRLILAEIAGALSAPAAYSATLRYDREIRGTDGAQ